MVDRIEVLSKIIGMFSPSKSKFLGFPAEQVILGPNDRAMCGFDNHFPKEWLIEDFGFTDEEAQWVIDQVAVKARSGPVANL